MENSTKGTHKATFIIQKQLSQRLTQISKEVGLSKSFLVRQALKNYLSAYSGDIRVSK